MIAIVSMNKRCSRCKEEKDISLFRKNRCRRDGLNEYCCDCSRTVQANYKKTHRENVNRLQREWSTNNKDKVNAIQRKYIANHPHKKISRNICSKLWHKKHPKADAECRRKYRLNHMIEFRSYCQNRRARISGNGGEYTAEEFIELCLSFYNKCACCGEEKPLTVDHIVPIKLGGKNVISNIQPLCQSCNSKKNIKVMDYRNARIQSSFTQTA